jgi:hypothetical protein
LLTHVRCNLNLLHCSCGDCVWSCLTRGRRDRLGGAAASGCRSRARARACSRTAGSGASAARRSALSLQGAPRCPAPPPPSLPYKVDTSRPSRRTDWTRLVPLCPAWPRDSLRRAALSWLVVGPAPGLTCLCAPSLQPRRPADDDEQGTQPLAPNLSPRHGGAAGSMEGHGAYRAEFAAAHGEPAQASCQRCVRGLSS